MAGLDIVMPGWRWKNHEERRGGKEADACRQDVGG